ncbi:MAG: acetyltransferase [Bacteroidales bacterium]|nr:acetyltransferase [Bacteroidales bacterium]
MTDLIIIGAGGHAAELDEYIRYNLKVLGQKKLNVVGFLDDNSSNYRHYKFSAPLLGGIKGHKVEKGVQYLLGIADINYRKLFAEKLKGEGAVFSSFLHCTALISETSQIGEGTIIGPNANVGPNVKIGKFTLINSRCSIGHDTTIGDLNFISPNVCFSGFTVVGDQNLFGINSATIPGITVGNRNKIAAGMVLDQKVGDDEVVFYRFKEKIIAVRK